jgi:YbbR domain-containing protein
MASRAKAGEIISKVFGLITKNFFMKALAVTTAVSVWAWVQNEKVTEETTKVTIQYLLPDGLAMIDLPRQRITAILEGPQGRIRSIDEFDLTTRIDLTDSVEGLTTIELSTADILNIPQGVEVIRLSPPALEVEFDKPMTREVQVNPNLVGSPSEGWDLTAQSVEPQTVTITGAQKVVSNIDAINTEVINIGSLQEDQTFKVALNLPNRTLEVDRKEPVKVRVEIKLLVEEMTFAEVPISLRDAEKWRIEEKTATVVLEGPSIEVSKLAAQDLTVLLSPPETQEQGFAFQLDFNPELEKQPIKVIHGGSKDIKTVSIEPSSFTLTPIGQR